MARRARARRGDAAGSARRRSFCWRCSSTRSFTASCSRSSRRRAAGSPTIARFFSDPVPLRHDRHDALAGASGYRLNLALAVPIAFRVRLMRRQRLLTTILVLPVTLGTVLVAEGLLNYLGPQGWFNRTLLAHRPDRAAGTADAQLLGRFRLAAHHRLSLHLPPHSLLRHRHRSGPGAAPRRRSAPTRGSGSCHVYLPLLAPGIAVTFCLSFVQAFSVFPSAVLLGAPAGPTRVISIAAYQAAFEHYDYSLASAIAMIMGFVQLLIVGGRPLGAGPRLSRPEQRRRRARPMIRDTTLGAKLWATVVWVVTAILFVNLLAMIATVVVSSFSTRWLRSWFPAGLTTRWYDSAWTEFQLDQVLIVTFEIALDRRGDFRPPRCHRRLRACPPRLPRQAPRHASFPAAACSSRR